MISASLHMTPWRYYGYRFQRARKLKSVKHRQVGDAALKERYPRCLAKAILTMTNFADCTPNVNWKGWNDLTGSWTDNFVRDSCAVLLSKLITKKRDAPILFYGVYFWRETLILLRFTPISRGSAAALKFVIKSVFRKIASHMAPPPGRMPAEVSREPQGPLEI